MEIIQVIGESQLLGLEDVDYSLEVVAVAEPPFDGLDIVNIKAVAPFQKTYPLPADRYRSHVGSPDSALFVAIKTGRTHGFIAVSVTWNGFAQIDDLGVASQARRRGLGAALIRKAIEWARKSGSLGLRVETQTLNVPACRLYRQCGFVLGGFDRFHYGATLDVSETALFWYLLLPR